MLFQTYRAILKLNSEVIMRTFARDIIGGGLSTVIFVAIDPVRRWPFPIFIAILSLFYSIPAHLFHARSGFGVCGLWTDIAHHVGDQAARKFASSDSDEAGRGRGSKSPSRIPIDPGSDGRGTTTKVEESPPKIQDASPEYTDRLAVTILSGHFFFIGIFSPLLLLAAVPFFQAMPSCTDADACITLKKNLENISGT